MNQKVLVVGDPHAVVEELDECEKLFAYVERVALDNQATRVVVLGDLNNTHNLVRVEVMNFWLRTLRQLSQKLSVYVIAGNHDFAGEGSDQHSLEVYKHLDGVEIMDRPMFNVLCNQVFMPYFPPAQHEAFIKKACEMGTPTLFCHQTFDGSKLDNGFFAPEAIDPNLLPQKYVISGHIHSPQRVGKVIYVGSPRWRTMDDANKDRSLRMFEFDDDGELVGEAPFFTNTVCREIRRGIDTPEAPLVIKPGDTARWYVDVRGPSEWVDERKKEYSGLNVRLRTFKTSAQTSRVRESEGIAVAFNRFLTEYAAGGGVGVPVEVLQQMAKERLHV